MAKKRAMIGFKGVALAPITQNDLVGYKTEAAAGIPYAGSMTKTPKEKTQDFYYDDELYAQAKDTIGEDIEIRFAEIPLDKLAELGLGTYDTLTGTLEADFAITQKSYALRCVCDTMDHLPMYFNYRVFDLNGIRFDNFTTKGENLTVCEVIMTGVVKKPVLASAKAYAIRQPKETGEDLTACDTWLAAAETLPAA